MLQSAWARHQKSGRVPSNFLVVEGCSQQVLDIGWWRITSSAHVNVMLPSDSCKSVMPLVKLIRMNRSDPSTEPCGTPGDTDTSKKLGTHTK